MQLRNTYGEAFKNSAHRSGASNALITISASLCGKRRLQSPRWRRVCANLYTNSSCLPTLLGCNCVCMQVELEDKRDEGHNNQVKCICLSGSSHALIYINMYTAISNFCCIYMQLCIFVQLILRDAKISTLHVQVIECPHIKPNGRSSQTKT